MNDGMINELRGAGKRRGLIRIALAALLLCAGYAFASLRDRFAEVAPMTVLNSGQCVNITSWTFGGAGDGVIDNSTALTKALKASSCVSFPAGHYVFLSQVSHNIRAGSSVRIVGVGQDISVLDWHGSNGLAFTFNGLTSSVTIADLTMSTNDSGSFTGISITQNSTVSSGAAQQISTLSNVTFRGNDGPAQSAKSWSIAVDILKASNISLINANFFGAAPISGGYTLVGTGVRLRGTTPDPAVQFEFVACNFAYLGVGILYGTEVQGVSVSTSNFTGGNKGIYVDGAATGTSQLIIAGSQFNDKASGIDSGVAVPGTSIVGNYFLPQNGGTGIILESAAYYSILGNVIQGPGNAPTANCLVVQSNSGNLGGIISGNVVAGCQTGVWFQANTNSNKMRGNAYRANTQNVLNESVSGSDTLGTANDLGDDNFTSYRALTMCNSSTAGTTATVIDSVTNVWGANITTGGGANIVRAVCNGRNWTVMGK